jgi:hypothetical protein
MIEWSRGSSTIAVLFLHGLGGCAVPLNQTAAQACAAGAEDSFRNTAAAKSWPELMAADDYQLAANALSNVLPKPLRISDLGIWGVDYSRLTTSGCATFSVPEAARLIRTQIESSRLFDRYEQVIVLAHSMGGLITKIMLLEWQTANDPDGMLARTIGVLLLGVPSQGSDAAPPPGVKRYLLETLRVDRLANTCARQVKDLFPGNENTYLFDLERRWEQLLSARRSRSQSQAPLVYCAYETVPEPILHGMSSLTIVQQLYTQTQCSDAQFPVPAYHTALPKPSSVDDDVHRAWFTRSLDNLFRQWVTWPFSRFDFASDATFRTFEQWINRQQRAFVLNTDEVKGMTPVIGKFEAPNSYAVTATVVAANSSVCMESQWPARGVGQVTLRPAGQCR